MFSIWYLNYMTYFILIPGIIFSCIAQYLVTKNFKKYSRVQIRANISTVELAKGILNANDCEDVTVQTIDGNLTDNYNSKHKTLNLSQSVSGQSSVSAIAVCAHECGHAIQDKKNSIFFLFRKVLVPVTNYGSMLAIPLILVGILLDIFVAYEASTLVLTIGIALYGLSTIFCLATLPVEIGASVRAYKILNNSGIVETREEKQGVKRVLTSAALTYVAALLVSLLSLLRLIVIIYSITGKNRK